MNCIHLIIALNSVYLQRYEMMLRNLEVDVLGRWEASPGRQNRQTETDQQGRSFSSFVSMFLHIHL